MVDALSEMLDALRDHQVRARNPVQIIPIKASREAQQAARRPVTVIYRTMPGEGFTEVTIHADTAELVTEQISREVRSALQKGLSANFKGPKRCISGFGAIGELVGSTR